MNSKRVLLVSAFGRSHWLAVAFAKMGIPTTLFDVSENLGSLVPEEVEGPFGFFQDENHSDHLSETLLERFQEDDSAMEVKNGFTLWLESGPVEFKGPVTSYRLRQLNVPSVVQDYILNPTPDLKKKTDSLRFEENWPAQLAHNLTANVYAPNPDSISISHCARLFAPYSLRLPTRNGHRRNLDWCRKHGVQVMDKVKINDVMLLNRKNIRGLEYQEEGSGKTQLIDGDQLVWGLTSEETQILGDRLGDVFFPGGALESEWNWTRYRLKVSEGLVREELPLHTVVIDDLGKPWAHHNLTILIRTGSVDFFDAWIRLPTVQRFNKSYLIERGRELIEVLSTRFVHLKFEISSYPLGYEFTFQQIGPSKQPIYDMATKSRWKPAHFQNVSLDSCEQAGGLGWRHQLEHQQQIFSHVTQWWNKILTKQKADGVAKSD